MWRRMWIEFRPRTCVGVGSHCGLLDEDPLCVKGGWALSISVPTAQWCWLRVASDGGFRMQLPLCVIG